MIDLTGSQFSEKWIGHPLSSYLHGVANVHAVVHVKLWNVPLISSLYLSLYLVSLDFVCIHVVGYILRELEVCTVSFC